MSAVGRPLRGPLAIVDLRLQAWGREQTGGLPGLGFPGATLLARIIEMGPMAGAGHGSHKTPQADPAISEIDRIVAQLTPRYRKVLRAWYVGYTAYNRCVAARSVRLEPWSFDEYLRHARTQVAEHLGIV